MTNNPRDLMIAKRVVDVIASSRMFMDGFSFQTGAELLVLLAQIILHNIWKREILRPALH